MERDRGEPEISEAEYKILKKTVQERGPDDPYFTETETPLEKGKVRLPQILGSLTKIRLKDLVTWLRNNGGWYVASDKIDGVSIYVEYEDGEVKFAASRGDGYYGQDLTEKAKIVCPPLAKDGKWSLRGEAVLMCDPAEIGYKTRRNGCAGVLNRDDNRHLEHIKVYYYEIIDAPPSFLDMDTELNRMGLLERLVPFVVDYHSVRVDDGHAEKDIETLFLMLHADAKNKEYECDGVVITVNYSEREPVLFPEKKIAFKVNEEAVDAEVEMVVWNTTRTGRVVPVVIIHPVEIGGVTITRATGFNYKFIVENGIMPGTKIKLVRSGDVIPYIVKTEKSVYHAIPEDMRCPSCGEFVTEKGVDLVCRNQFCGKQLYTKQSYWLRTLGAENITEKTLEKIKCESIPGLYDLDEFDIMELDGFGRKRASQVVQEIQKTLKTDDATYLAAIGIPGVAKETAKSLIQEFGSVMAVFQATRDQLQVAGGVGYTIAQTISEWQARCLVLHQNMLRQGLDLKKRTEESPITGKLFSMTGKLPMKRDLIVRLIESKGGHWKNSVTKKTDFLITDNPQSTSGKAKNAHKYGTRIISYKEFMEMIGEEI
jgi:DNA ligase (NAD+)